MEDAFRRSEFAVRKSGRVRGVAFKVNARLSSAELNTLFAAACPHHVQRDFRPALKHALVYVSARHRGRLIGFAKVVSDGGVHGFLLDPTVAPDWQRQGVGRRLVERCALEARKRGVEWLHVDFEPKFARFYTKCGFKPTRAGLRRLVG